MDGLQGLALDLGERGMGVGKCSVVEGTLYWGKPHSLTVVMARNVVG